MRAIHHYEGMAVLTMTDLEVHVTGGVDTHKDTHVAAALDQLGRVLGTEAFPATAAGYAALLHWLTTSATSSRSGSKAPAPGVPAWPGS